MPKKSNSILNYFGSPKVKSPRAKVETPKSKTSPRTPKSTRKTQPQENSNIATTPTGTKRRASSRSKSETPKQKKKVEKKTKSSNADKNTKGKENVRQNRERKRPIPNFAEDDSEDEDFDSAEESPQPKKKRRIIVPDVEGEDSEDDYKPSSNDEAEESETELSEAVSESEPESEKDSDDEPAQKSQVRSNNNGRKAGRGGGGKGKVSKDTLSTVHAESTSVAKASTTQAWPHLKYDFLQPENIKDKEKRRPSDPEYNPRTLFVPKDFLDNQTPAMRQWWVLKMDHFDSLLCFKVGKFYELYHMDAVVGANELNISFMKGDFAHSGFPEMAWGRFSQNLIERGHKIARVEQTENPEMANARCAKLPKVTKFDKVVKREICQISTRGTRVYNAQDNDAASPSSTFLLSIYEKFIPQKNVSAYGICFIDTTIGEFYLGQFEDDRCNSRFLTLIAHYPAAHIVYERNNLSQMTLKILHSYLPGSLKDPLNKESQFWHSQKVLKILHDGDYFKKDDEFYWPEGLKPYLNKADTLGLTPEEDKELAVNALGGCVYILKEFLLEQQLLGQGRFKTYIPPDFSPASEKKSKTSLAHNMVLDAITINNLRILGNEGSLIKILDQCCTAFGKRLIREWICRPSCRKSVIIQRQEAITELLDNPDVAREVRLKLNSLPDLERLLSKIHAQGNAAKLRNHPDARAIMFDAQTYSKKTITDFIITLNGYEEVLNIIDQFSSFKSFLIKKCTKVQPQGDFPDMKKTLDHFKNAFDHEEAKTEGFIVPKTGVDDDYDNVLREFSEITKESDDYLVQMSKQFATKIKYTGTDRKRYQLEIPENASSKVGNNFELQGQRKGFKRYYTAESRDFLTRITAAEEKKEKVLKDINRKIFAKFSEHYDEWSTAAYNVAVLDCILSLAEYARTCETCVPEIYDDTDKEGIFIEIRDGKHPCILSDNFIPNDTLIATEDSAPLMILTGPNMGGKSTIMRQVGLITVMAQIGCHVPASACRLTLVDRIFTRLGANDDIMAGQSTFLVELSETAAILQHATQYSLVLLDELGRGTSTYDGTAIAASVVEALTKMKCRTLFSTHYHSLVEDYKTNKNVTLAHMACMVENDEEEVSEENVTFLYKLSEGACPKSYGFNAARLAGIPADITKRAQYIATKLETEVNLRHAFTALCRLKDSKSIKPLFEKTLTLLAKVEI